MPKQLYCIFQILTFYQFALLIDIIANQWKQCQHVNLNHFSYFIIKLKHLQFKAIRSSFKIKMGISQSLQKVTQHPKFSQVQYGADQQITVAHYKIDDYEIKQWRYNFNCKFRPEDKQRYPHILLVFDDQIAPIKDGFCSDTCKILIKMEKLLQTTLERQIQNRKSIERYFPQEQIWEIALKIVQTLVPLHQKSEVQILGNLHPSNMLISKQGQIKLICQFSLPFQTDHFTTFRKKNWKQSYIAPELVGFLFNTTYKEYPNYPSCIDPQKAQSYCLGLTLLSVCCLQTDLSNMLYTGTGNPNYVSPSISRQASSRHNYTNLINFSFFQQKMHLIESRYSRVLSMVIKCLLQDLPQNRLSVTQLWDVLLKQKRGYIQAMDGRWYIQSLQTIEQGGQRENDYDDNEEGTQEGNLQGPGKMDSHFHASPQWRNHQVVDKHYNQKQIESWQRSLEKKYTQSQRKLPPKKISFTYL